MNVDDVISKLKFIGLIEKDEKIDTRNIQRQPSNFYTTFIRSFVLRDNRYNTLKFLKDVISQTFVILEEKKSPFSVKKLLIDLNNSKTGIENLKHTYSSDTKFCCDLELLLEKIKTKIEDLENNK